MLYFNGVVLLFLAIYYLLVLWFALDWQARGDRFESGILHQ
jgi:hypothetical protein